MLIEAAACVAWVLTRLAAAHVAASILRLLAPGRCRVTLARCRGSCRCNNRSAICGQSTQLRRAGSLEGVSRRMILIGWSRGFLHSGAPRQALIRANVACQWHSLLNHQRGDAGCTLDWASRRREQLGEHRSRGGVSAPSEEDCFDTHSHRTCQWWFPWPRTRC